MKQRKAVVIIGIIVALAAGLVGILFFRSRTPDPALCERVCAVILDCRFLFDDGECRKQCQAKNQNIDFRRVDGVTECESFLSAFETVLPDNLRDIVLTQFRIDAAIADPQRAADLAAAGAAENRWLHYFHLGMALGQTQPEPSERWTTLAALVPEQMQPNFYDGLSDGMTWNTADQQATLEKIDRFVPATYRHLFHFGLFLDYVLEHQADAVACQEFFARFDERYAAAIQKGLAVGVVRLHLDDFDRATQAILAFDPMYHRECFEELGWQVGDNYQSDVEQANALLAKIPRANRGDAYHGYIRALEFEDSLEPIEWLIERIPPEFHPDCYRAIGWKISVKTWGDEGKKQEMLSRLKKKEYLPYVREKLNNPLEETRPESALLPPQP